MRTIRAKFPKGQEPAHAWRDNLRLLRYILSAGLNYLIVGYAIRKAGTPSNVPVRSTTWTSPEPPQPRRLPGVLAWER